VALRDTLEQVMRVAPYCPVKIGSSIGLLLSVRKGVLATWDIRPKNSSFSENGCPK